jgi:hypothetical protein
MKPALESTSVPSLNTKIVGSVCTSYSVATSGAHVNLYEVGLLECTESVYLWPAFRHLGVVRAGQGLIFKTF